MENTQNNSETPNLTARQAAEIIIAANTPSLVGHIVQDLPFRLATQESVGGHFTVAFTSDGGMSLEVDKLAVESRVPNLEPDRTDFMILMGTFLIQQAESSVRRLQVDHLTKQLEELEQSGAVKLGPTVSPELVQMLASMQQSGSATTDEMLANRGAGVTIQ